MIRFGVYCCWFFLCWLQVGVGDLVFVGLVFCVVSFWWFVYVVGWWFLTVSACGVGFLWVLDVFVMSVVRWLCFVSASLLVF